MDEMITLLFYPVFLLIVFILTLIFIPREKYKEYFIYGFLTGALGDIIVVGLTQNVLGLIWFKNQGIFYVHKMIALSPLCWSMVMMIFFYFLPERKYFRYVYILTWAFYSLGYGYVVHNVGLFSFVDWFYPLPAYIIFLCWWTFASWFFRKTSPLAK
jgi:hypothetical protein